MKWTPEAEAAVKKVPFFVRKKVRERVENEAAAAGKRIISLAEVNATRARYIKKMQESLPGREALPIGRTSLKPAEGCSSILSLDRIS